MAFLAALLAFGSRFVGKILMTALGWASTLLFGRVPQDRQILLLGITFGSVIWIVLLFGVLFPDIGTFLLVLVPQQDVIPEDVIRLIMLIAALIVPGVIGALTLMLSDRAARTPQRIATGVLRGYPLTLLLSVLLIFLAGLAMFRKARSVLKRWTDAHVPIVVQPGKYDEVAADLEEALRTAGLEVEPRTAPAAMSKPATWLAAVAGGDAATLVPDRLIQLDGTDLDILIYPMDLLVSGKPRQVAQARAAMASRLTTSSAHLTTSAEAQGVEDRLRALGKPPGVTPDHPPRFDDAAAAEFAAIDEQLATLEIPYEEWEVLYRQRLQVERDLRAGAMAGEAVLGAETPGPGRGATLGTVGRLVRDAAEAVLGVATDDRTGQAIDRMAGPQWRIAARAASVAASTARGALRARAREAEIGRGRSAVGQPEADPARDRGQTTPGALPAALPGRSTERPGPAGQDGPSTS